MLFVSVQLIFNFNTCSTAQMSFRAVWLYCFIQSSARWRWTMNWKKSQIEKSTTKQHRHAVSAKSTDQCRYMNIFQALLRSRVVYKSQQLAKFAGFSARFCRLLSLLHEYRCVKEMMFIRSHNHLLFTKLQLLKNLKKTLWEVSSIKTCLSCLTKNTYLVDFFLILWHFLQDHLEIFHCCLQNKRKI